MTESYADQVSVLHWAIAAQFHLGLLPCPPIDGLLCGGIRARIARLSAQHLPDGEVMDLPLAPMGRVGSDETPQHIEGFSECHAIYSQIPIRRLVRRAYTLLQCMVHANTQHIDFIEAPISALS